MAREPAGCILHVDGGERRLDAGEVDEEFVGRVASFMRQIPADESAPHAPSAAECGRCPLTSEHCSERVESPGGGGASDLPASC